MQWHQERGGSRVQWSTGASSQTNPPKGTVWLQAQGRAGIHQALLPLVAVPSLSPVQCCSCSNRSAWSKHSDSELARAKGPAFTGKRLHGEGTANLSAHGEGPVCHFQAQVGHTGHQAEVIPTQRDWTQSLNIPSGLSKDGFTEA